MSKGLESLENLEKFVNETMGINHFKESGWHIQGTKDYSIIEKELERLEAIDNSKPSEALNYLSQFINEMTYCLENQKEFVKGYEKQIFWKYKNTFETTTKQALLKEQEQEKVIIELCEYCGMDNLYPYDNLKEIEITFKDTFDNYERQRMESLGRLIKQKKILEIIKEKNVNIFLLKQSDTVIKYNAFVKIESVKGFKELTQEEFDTLKRWLDE